MRDSATPKTMPAAAAHPGLGRQARDAPDSSSMPPRFARTCCVLGANNAHSNVVVTHSTPAIICPARTLFAGHQPFRPAMLAHAIEETDFASLDPKEFMAEWKWDGIRVQAVTGTAEDGRALTRLYSRTGEDISKSFPDLADALWLPGAVDGELLIVRDGRVQSFNVLQQRLNRKAVTAKLLAEFPAHLRAYDLLAEGEDDLRDLPFAERRKRLEAFIAKLNDHRVDLSPLVPFTTWPELINTARSITWSSSRTLPGQEWARKAAKASGVKPIIDRR